MKNGSCDSHQVQKRLCLCAVHFLKCADACGFHGLVVAVSWLLPLNVFLKTEERVWTPETKGNKLYFVMQWCVLPEEAGDILFFPSYRARVLWDLYMKRFMQNLANCSGKVLCKASQHHPKTEIAGLGAALFFCPRKPNRCKPRNLPGQAKLLGLSFNLNPSCQLYQCSELFIRGQSKGSLRK